MTIPSITPKLPEWLDKAEKWESSPPGVECRAVVFQGKTWYVRLSSEEIVARELEAEARKAERDRKARIAWAEYDEWTTLTLEQKVEKLRPRPPTVPRPGSEPGDGGGTDRRR